MSLSVRDYILVGDGLLVTFNDNSVVQLTYRVVDSTLVPTGSLTNEQRTVLREFVNSKIDVVLPEIDARLRQAAGGATGATGPAGAVGATGATGATGPALTGAAALTFKSYNLVTGNPDTYYVGGYYDFNDADANLTQASATVTFGVVNNTYAAHACIVAGGPGTVVGGGQVGLRVTGTSITDLGVRTTSDSETIVNDITTLSLNQFVEGKKWLGQITFELFVVSGAPTSYSLDFNYGYAKYEDFGNNDFILTDLECVGRGAASDANFDIILYHHSTAGWTYAATGFAPGGTVIASLQTDHSTDNSPTNNVRFAYKRSGLTTVINGADSEGILVGIITSTGNAIETMDVHIGVC